MTNTLEIKKCKKCGNEYPFDKFPYYNKSLNARRNECRLCYNARKNREYHKRKGH